MFLATASVSKAVLGEDPSLFAFAIKPLQQGKEGEAMISNVKVRPIKRIDSH